MPTTKRLGESNICVAHPVELKSTTWPGLLMASISSREVLTTQRGYSTHIQVRRPFLLPSPKLTCLGAMIRQIAEHSHFVQGVAWDPLNEFVATQSSDRSVHIYALKLKDGTPTLSTHGKFNKMDLPGRRISSNSPAPADMAHRPSNASQNNLAIASPAPSNPGTPLATPLPMDPPIIASSRRSSFGSSPHFVDRLLLPLLCPCQLFDLKSPLQVSTLPWVLR